MPALQIHAIYQLINSVSLIKFKKENRLIQMMAKQHVLHTTSPNNDIIIALIRLLKHTLKVKFFVKLVVN